MGVISDAIDALEDWCKDLFNDGITSQFDGISAALFAFWEDALVEDRLPDDPTDPNYAANRRRFLLDYERTFNKLRRAERCTGCGRCAPHCPQAIDIPAMVRKVDRFVETLRRNGRA